MDDSVGVSWMKSIFYDYGGECVRERERDYKRLMTATTQHKTQSSYTYCLCIYKYQISWNTHYPGLNDTHAMYL